MLLNAMRDRPWALLRSMQGLSFAELNWTERPFVCTPLLHCMLSGRSLLTLLAHVPSLQKSPIVDHERLSTGRLLAVMIWQALQKKGGN